VKKFLFAGPAKILDLISEWDVTGLKGSN